MASVDSAETCTLLGHHTELNRKIEKPHWWHLAQRDMVFFECLASELRD